MAIVSQVLVVMKHFYSKVGMRQVKDALKGLACFSLIFLYVISNTELDYVHRLVHPIPVVDHSEESEQDQCHRAIYHDEPEDNCTHETHNLLKSKCSSCDAIRYSKETFFNVIFSPLQFAEKLQVEYQAIFITSELTCKIPRAPPV